MMTKSQTVAHLAEKVGIPKKTTVAVLEELVSLATKEAKSSGQFVVPGLGKAVKANRKARTGRNPQTGEAIKIPAKTVVKFRLAKAFKDAVVPPKKNGCTASAAECRKPRAGSAPCWAADRAGRNPPEDGRPSPIRRWPPRPLNCPASGPAA